MIEEVDEELQKTERKSRGENAHGSFEAKENHQTEDLDQKSTPNINLSKYQNQTSSKSKSDKKTITGQNLSNEVEESGKEEKERIAKHLEEEEKIALEIMRAAKKIENVPFFLF